MIHGTVFGLQARMNIILRLPEGSDFEIECVVDAGFEGFLTLPPVMIRELDLPYVARIDSRSFGIVWSVKSPSWESGVAP